MKEEFTEHELKCILNHILKNQPEGRFKGNLCNKIVNMISILKNAKEKPNE